MAKQSLKNRVVRFGIIGTGGMGYGHCKSLSKVPHARLTAVCDVNAASVERVGKEMGVPFFTDHRQLIRSGLCDAVIIVTPHPLHPPTAIDCMKAGLHVLSEKPLSERVSTAEQMAKTAKKHRIAFAVMFQRRFEPLYAKAIQMVKQGKLGQIYRATMISPEYRTQAYYDSGSWRATWKGEGGGVMLNQAPHIIDLFIQLCGMPSEVYGHTETRMHRIEVEDLAEAMLKLPRGGTGYLYCSTCEWGPGQMIELFGDKGKLIIRDNQMKFYRFNPAIRKHLTGSKVVWSFPEVKEETISVPKKETGHFSVMTNFVRHILFREPLVTSGASGIASLELANAITLSAHEGRWIKLPIDRKRYDRLLNTLCKTSKFVKKAAAAKRVTDPRFKL